MKINKTIIGLGSAGIEIANTFSTYEGFSPIALDYDQVSLSGTKKENIITLPAMTQVIEEYEETIPDNLFKGKVLDKDILFVVGGGGKISVASLRIIEQLKKEDKNVSILYVKPDRTFLAEQNILLDKITFSILQEYTRSGHIERMWIVSNPEIESLLGGLPIIGYNEGINKAIVSSFHTYYNFKESKPVMSTLSTLPTATRFSTLGMFDETSQQEKSFFPLDFVTDVEYYFAFNEEKLKVDKKVLNSIKSTIHDKNTVSKNRCSYGVFATIYKDDFVLFHKATSFIQLNK